jgi:hypothetical protein
MSNLTSNLPVERPGNPPIATQPPWCRSVPAPIACKTAQQLCGLVAVTTAAAFAIPVGELTANTRRTSYIAFARQSAMYLAHVTLGLSYSEVGRGFGRDRTTAAYACRLIEDRRDDPAVDGVLGSLENVCCGLRRRQGAPVQS